MLCVGILQSNKDKLIKYISIIYINEIKNLRIQILKQKKTLYYTQQ